MILPSRIATATGGELACTPRANYATCHAVTPCTPRKLDVRLFFDGAGPSFATGAYATF
jgi:hypothetical protein